MKNLQSQSERSSEQSTDGASPSDYEGEYSATWLDVDESVPVELSAATTAIVLRNRSSFDRRFALELYGDAGTTALRHVEMPEVMLGGGTDHLVEVDLAALVQGDGMKYSGVAHVAANVLDADSGERIGRVVSPSLYYHPTASGAYEVFSRAVLEDTFRGGDFLGFHTDEELFAVGDTEATIVDRVLDFVPSVAKMTPANEFPERGESNYDSRLVWSHQGSATAVHEQDEVFGAEAPTSSAVHPHELCVNFEVDTLDSGDISNMGITEDVWADANSGQPYAANGVRVKIGSTTYDAGSDGCISFTSGASIFQTSVRVYTFASDGSGNFVRIHSGGQNMVDDYPGATYSHYISC